MKSMFAAAFASNQADFYQQLPIINCNESNYF